MNRSFCCKSVAIASNICLVNVSHGSDNFHTLVVKILENSPNKNCRAPVRDLDANRRRIDFDVGGVDTNPIGKLLVKIPQVPAGVDRAASWAWRLVVCSAALALVLFLLWYLKVIVLPAIIAMTIAPVLTPVANWLRRLGWNRFAPAIALIVGLLVIAGLLSIITISVGRGYDELADAIVAGVDNATNWLEGPPLNLALDGSIGESLGDLWRQGSQYLVAGALSGVSLITGLVLAIAILYFVLRDGASLWQGILRRLSPESRLSIDRAGMRAWETLGGFFRGTAVIAAIDASLIGIGLWILGVPLAFALTVLIFLGSFIPFVGATIAGLVAVLVAFADGGPVRAGIALAIVLGVQFLEGNFLQPIIQSRTVDLHPAVILLAVAAGGALFGILGAYLAVPLTAVAFAVLASLASAPLDNEADMATAIGRDD